MKTEIPLVQLVTESFELCSIFLFQSSGLRWKIRPKSHFPSTELWRSWNQKHAGRPVVGIVMSDENDELYRLIEIEFFGSRPSLYLWSERVAYILALGEDNPKGDHFGGLYREGNQ